MERDILMGIVEKRDICPECNKARELIIEVNGNRSVVRAICDCEIKEEERLAELRKKDIAEMKEGARFKRAFGERVIKGSFDGDPNHALEVGKRYVDNFEANKGNKTNGIIFHGSARQGKTYAAEAIAYELFKQGFNVYMSTAMEIVQSFQYDPNNKIEALRKRMDKADLIVIDDLGASRDTEFGKEIIFSIVDSRYTSGRPLIATTNKSLEEMQENIEDQRLYGRILERCYPCEVENNREVLTHESV